MNVPFVDLSAAHTEIRPDVDAAIARVVDRGQFILGPELAAFESEFAEFVGVVSCVGVGNGQDALELAIRALGLQPGDEVIVPGNTYIATWLAVTRAGGLPVPVDPVLETFNLDSDAVASAITARTRGIIAVHLYGQPADMTRLRQIADDLGVWLLEDAAQAHGARWRGERVGGFGDAAAWSFYPSKNLGAMGDAGAVTTNRVDVAERVRLLRNYGSREKYAHEIRGVNSRLDEIQAAILRVKLSRLDAWNARRADVARRYLHGLADARVALPVVADGAEPVWHLFVVRDRRRDELAAAMAQHGVETAIHYPVPPHLQAAYSDLGHTRGSLPITEEIHREVLSLPMGPHMPNAAVDHVIESVLAP